MEKLKVEVKKPDCPWLNRVACYNYKRLVINCATNEILLMLDAYPTSITKYPDTYTLTVDSPAIIIADIEDITNPWNSPIHVLHSIYSDKRTECIVRSIAHEYLLKKQKA